MIFMVNKKLINPMARIVLLLALPVVTYSQQFSEKFDSKYHQKAKGAWFTVRYPAGWVAKEGDRPNIVKKFNGDFNGIFTNLMVHVLKVDGPVETECQKTSALEMAKTLTDDDPKFLTSNARKIRHENKPAFLFDISQNIERAGLSLGTINRVMAVCSDTKLIMLWCSGMKIDSRAGTITSTSKELDVVSPVCQQFFNSLVLMDTYK